MDDEVTTPAGTGRRRRAIYTAALAGGLVLGGFGIAAAQTSTTSPPTTAAPNGDTAPTAPAPPADGPRAHMGKRGPGGLGMMGGAGAIRGELTVPDGNGGYRTMVFQRGTVTGVSSTSVTVRSDDGYEKTYTVDDNTLVNAGNEGIGDVKKDDKVNVQAFLDGNTARAARVMDETGVGAIRDYWKPKSA